MVLATALKLWGDPSDNYCIIRTISLPIDLGHFLRQKKPCLWSNDLWQPIDVARAASTLGMKDVQDADRRLRQFAGLLTRLFPELEVSDGIIESPLYAAEKLQKAMNGKGGTPGRWFIKGDHALPVAGSIKARGGIYEVLLHAETLALRESLIKHNDDRGMLATPAARELFSKHEVAVGSTGNLGLSIGIMAAALGFQATVHMSSDAKEWKKARLRARGVEVVDHAGDFGAAVAAGRERTLRNARAYFVDDENSDRLFLGYSVAALRLQQQLNSNMIRVDARHPLFVYLPCGVGGAPGGITFGLRHLFGDHVHCFFAEPVACPSMLIRLAATEDVPTSVMDIGLDGRTEADGLAVGKASEFVARLMRPLVSGLFTVPDVHLFEDLYRLQQSEGLHVEPSAVAAFRGPHWLLESEVGKQYLFRHHLFEHMGDAAHVLWTTGGAFMPDQEYWKFHERGRLAIK